MVTWLRQTQISFHALSLALDAIIGNFADYGVVYSGAVWHKRRDQSMRSYWKHGLLVAGLALLAVYAAPADGHHAFGAEFDAEAPIQIEGRVLRLEWVNPHSWIHLEVTKMVQVDGEVVPTNPSQEVWMVEGGTPNVLVRRGLRRECIPVGTALVVDGYQAKDHTLKRANGRDVTFPDGRKFFMGSSGTGAPDEAARAADARGGGARC